MEPLAYWNGELIPASRMAVPVWDAGFVQGVTITEQLRTFRGELFRLESHLERLEASLRTVQLDPQISMDELGRIAAQLAANNHRLLDPDDDLGLSLFVTPGPYAAFAPQDAHGPHIGMHTYPVAFAGFAAKYETGQRLIVTQTRQVPPSCWPASLKCRSRMHYFLADQEARRSDPTARALLLDEDGFISEASTASFLLFRSGTGFLSPPREKVLPSVSVATLEDIAGTLGIPFVCRNLTLDDLAAAEEAYLSSTSPCLLPVVGVDGRPIGDGTPGPTFRRAIAAWSELVGQDIIGQAKRFATRAG
jgi:branched-subunit amino acid aminotransferase/4-amino-4-deoxychorismate lyase